MSIDSTNYRSDDQKYDQLQEQQLNEWEGLCQCCGSCCGVLEDDPCEHLIERGQGKYDCNIYETRFGIHKTKNGRPFQCVPIREILNMSWSGNQNCRYKCQKIPNKF